MATTSPSIVTMKLTLIGAPTDIGASVAGCRLGPGALRVAGIEKALRAFGVDVRDAGDVIGPSNPQSPPVDGYRHLPEVIEWNRAVRDVVAAELADGRMPVLMGGDHSLAMRQHQCHRRALSQGWQEAACHLGGRPRRHQHQ